MVKLVGGGSVINGATNLGNLKKEKYFIMPNIFVMSLSNAFLVFKRLHKYLLESLDLISLVFYDLICPTKQYKSSFASFIITSLLSQHKINPPKNWDYTRSTSNTILTFPMTLSFTPSLSNIFLKV